MFISKYVGTQKKRMTDKNIQMYEDDIVKSFEYHLRDIDMDNDFKTFWGGKWSSITKKCLNVAKNNFVLRKAFEMFRAKYVSHQYSEKKSSFSDLFVVADEILILTNLCKHVVLNPDEFISLGLNLHKRQCTIFCINKCTNVIQ